MINSLYLQIQDILEKRNRLCLTKPISQPHILSQRPLYTWLDLWLTIKSDQYKEAAVLVPMLYKDARHYLLFTRRTDQVEYHKGEISFPGGARDPEDSNLLDTALRETQEEIGIFRQQTRVLGALDDVFTVVSQFIVTPYVGIIQSPITYQINPLETKEILEIPLQFFLEEHNYWEGTFRYQGKNVRSYFFQWRPDTIIWGVTAYIVKNLCAILKQQFVQLPDLAYLPSYF